MLVGVVIQVLGSWFGPRLFSILTLFYLECNKTVFCRYQPPVLAISSLYWKAWTVLLILAAFNPASFGKLDILFSDFSTDVMS